MNRITSSVGLDSGGSGTLDNGVAVSADPRCVEPASVSILAPARPRLNPHKLLLSKWTAVAPTNKEKHFVVITVIKPEPPQLIEFVELEAVHSRRSTVMRWQDLTDTATWRQGWV